MKEDKPTRLPTQDRLYRNGVLAGIFTGLISAVILTLCWSFYFVFFESEFEGCSQGVVSDVYWDAPVIGVFLEHHIHAWYPDHRVLSNCWHLFLYSYMPFLGIVFTFVDVIVGALFGFGFVSMRKRKTQFYKHPVRDWITKWTILLLICTVCTVFLAYIYGNGMLAMPLWFWLWRFCFLLVTIVVAGLIGGHLGGRRLNFPINPDFEQDDLKRVAKRPPIIKIVASGIVSGVVSGSLFSLVIAVLNIAYSTYYTTGHRIVDFVLSTYYLPDGQWAYAGGIPYFFAYFTLVGLVTGVLFGFGFSLSRWWKTQFYNHLVRDWIVAWTFIFLVSSTFITARVTYWNSFTLLMSISFITTGLIGGYVGVKRLNSE